MQHNCSWIGIGLDLPPLLVQQCNVTNKEINKINSDSYQFTQNNRPHLNLYDLDVPESSISEITFSLSDVLKPVSSFEVKVLKIGYFPFGTIFFEVEKHSALLNLHNVVVSTVSKYRGNCVCKDYLQPWRNYTQGQKEMLKNYGNPFVLDEYFPHISLGFIKASEEVLKTHVEYLNKIVGAVSFEIESVSIVDDAQKGHNTLATLKLG